MIAIEIFQAMMNFLKNMILIFQVMMNLSKKMTLGTTRNCALMKNCAVIKTAQVMIFVSKPSVRCLRSIFTEYEQTENLMFTYIQQIMLWRIRVQKMMCAMVPTL